MAVARVSPTATVNATSNIFPSTVGQAVTLTASIDGSAAVPTGTVQFLEGTQPLGTRTLSGGQAAFTITPTTAGTHTFFANYSGDSAYPAASVRYFQMVNRVADSLSLSSSAAASVSGQTLTFTAQIGPQPPAGVASPSGRVQFLDGLSVIGTGTPSSGAATFNFASLAMGSHQIAAFYSGDNNWYAVKSAYIAVTVNRAATTTVLSVAPALTQATLTATVTVTPPGSGTLADSVQFMDTATNTAFGTVQFSEKTMARISIDASQAVAMAGHPIRAVYSGSADCASSTSNPMGIPAIVSASGSPSSTWLRIGW